MKKRSIALERLFVQNLRSREIEAQVQGKRRPLYGDHLLERDIHVSDFDVPEDSAWAGQSLRQLQFRTRYGVHVSSILRGHQRINIPGGDDIIFPGDRLQAIGSDEQLQAFGKALKGELVPEDPNIEEREMKLRKMVLSRSCAFLGKTLGESGIRDRYSCMVVGVEEGQQNLTMISPSRKFTVGDIIWVVGERNSLEMLAEANNGKNATSSCE